MRRRRRDGADALECGGTDCDDADRNRAPGNVEICDPAMRDEDCDPVTFGFRDADGDGVGDAACCNGSGADIHCGADCDDVSPSVHPSAPEVCNDRDDDCDGAVDEGVLTDYSADCDGDGHGVRPGDPVSCGSPATRRACALPAGYSASSDDCDDTAAPGSGALAFPGRVETCADGVDNDCSGVVDDGEPLTTYCVDADHDGWVTTSCTSTCSAPPPDAIEPPAGHDPALAPDCDDGDPRIHPGASDGCGTDLDCDGVAGPGMITWYADCDGDGRAAATAVSITSCVRPASPPSCTPPAGACMPTVDARWTTIAPDASTLDCDDFHASVFTGSSYAACDGADSNCDGALEPADDADRDGFATCGCGTLDCNDGLAAAHPGATEVVADGIDESCDGREICYVDGDRDGYGGATEPSTDTSCTAAGHVRADRAGDCCDSDAGTRPGTGIPFHTSANACGRWDWDCNGTIESSYPMRQVASCGAAPACTAIPGWYGSGYVDCGSPGQWATSCFDSAGHCFVDPPSTPTRQTCR